MSPPFNIKPLIKFSTQLDLINEQTYLVLKIQNYLSSMNITSKSSTRYINIWENLKRKNCYLGF